MSDRRYGCEPKSLKWRVDMVLPGEHADFTDRPLAEEFCSEYGVGEPYPVIEVPNIMSTRRYGIGYFFVVYLIVATIIAAWVALSGCAPDPVQAIGTVASCRFHPSDVSGWIGDASYSEATLADGSTLVCWGNAVATSGDTVWLIGEQAVRFGNRPITYGIR